MLYPAGDATATYRDLSCSLMGGRGGMWGNRLVFKGVLE